MIDSHNDRKIWQAPWGYSESFAVVYGLLFIGILLQITVGSFEFYLLARPVNLYVGGVILLLSALLGFRARSSHFARWISGVPAAVATISALLILTIIMGLTMQMSESSTVLGFDSMTSNWAFVLIYTFSLLSLGALIFRRIIRFRLKDIPFYLNHIGVWLFLISSGLGYADMQRYVMYVPEGELEWRVYDEEGDIRELPVAIKLIDFSMEVYNPKLALIDNATGAVQPIERPKFFQIDEDDTFASIEGWDIEVLEYIHKAVREGSDSYREVYMPGATPAVKVRVSRQGEVIDEGWVCGGNASQLHMAMVLNDDYSLVMTTPEPRSYTSKVEVYAEDGSQYDTTIEVNSPLRCGSWSIYQYGYDNKAGNLSTYSSFELVYDSWLLPVYIGVILIMLGSVSMIWTGRKIGGR